MNNKSFEELKEYALDWAKDKDLLYSQNADKQFMKFIEEVFEFKSELDLYTNHVGKMKDLSKVHLKDEMGDIFVTLIILCEQFEIDPVVCLEMAYEKVKGRSGKTINGTFVKESDL